VQLDASGVPGKLDGAVDDVLQNGFEPHRPTVNLFGAISLRLSTSCPSIEDNHGAEQDY